MTDTMRRTRHLRHMVRVRFARTVQARWGLKEGQCFQIMLPWAMRRLRGVRRGVRED